MPFAAASKLTSGIRYFAQTKPNSPMVTTSFTAGILTAWLLVNQTIAAQEAEFEQDRLSFP